MTTANRSLQDDPLTTLLRFGLSRAIQAHSEELRASHPHLALDLDLIDDENLLPEHTCRVLYHVYDEALKNVVRHAEASRVWVHYYLLPDRMILEIKDDGKGFSIPSDWAKFARSGSGVMGLKTRLEAIGGSLHIASEPGQGTHIEAAVPLS